MTQDLDRESRRGIREEVVYSVIVFLEFDCGAEPDIW